MLLIGFNSAQASKQELANEVYQSFGFKCTINKSIVLCPRQGYNEELEKYSQAKISKAKESSDKEQLSFFKSVQRSLEDSKQELKLEHTKTLLGLPSSKDFLRRIKRDFGLDCKDLSKVQCSNLEEHLTLLPNINEEYLELKYLANSLENAPLSSSLKRKLNKLVLTKETVLKQLLKARYME